MIDKNILAANVARREGKKKEVDIAQIKEIQRIIFEELSKYPDEEIIEVVRRIK